MIEISIDASSVIDTVTRMQNNLTNFPNEMGQELTNWQREDMRRTKNPNTSVTENTAETIITQHTPGGEEQNKQKQLVRTRRRRVHEGRMAKTVQHRPRGSQKKPILRPELFTMLQERMLALLQTCLHWQPDKK